MNTSSVDSNVEYWKQCCKNYEFSRGQMQYRLNEYENIIRSYKDEISYLRTQLELALLKPEPNVNPETEGDAMSTYKERISIEKMELDEKLEKLGAFFRAYGDMKLSEKSRRLLYKQEFLMYRYSEVLEQRLNLED